MPAEQLNISNIEYAVILDADDTGSFGLMHYLNLRIQSCLESIGLTVKRIPVNEPEDFLKLLNIIINDKVLVYTGWSFYDLCINCHRLGMVNIFDITKTPVLATIGDHPYTDFMWQRIENIPENIFFISGYSSLFQELERCRSLDLSRCHMVNLPSRFDPINTSAELSARPIEVLVPWKIFRTSETIEGLVQKITKNHPRFGEVTRGVYDACRYNHRINIFGYLLKSIEQNRGQKYLFGKKFNSTDYRILSIASTVDKIIRAERRIDLLVEILKNVEMEVMLLGDEKTKEFFHNYRIRGAKGRLKIIDYVDAGKLSRMYMESKYVLNCNPTYNGGIHERIRQAAAAGCCVISDENDTLNDYFEHGHSIYFSTMLEHEGYDALLDEEKREQVARRGREVILDNYNEEQFFHSMKEFLLQKGLIH